MAICSKDVAKSSAYVRQSRLTVLPLIGLRKTKTSQKRTKHLRLPFALNVTADRKINNKNICEHLRVFLVQQLHKLLKPVVPMKYCVTVNSIT